MKITFKKVSLLVSAFGLAAVSLQSCENPNSPGVEYMPDMYRTPALEPYQGYEFFADSMEARKPVANTIPRGYMPYAYANTNEGYEAAGANLKNPLPYSKETLAEGKVLFEKFCVHCHGKTGQGDGAVPSNSDYPPPPAYNGALKDLSEGKIFHTIHFGKGMMGSHASQLSQEERWKIVYYIQKLQGKDLDALHTQKAEADSIPQAEVVETNKEAKASH